MAKPIGSPKSGGRKKGTPNKKTLILSEALQNNGLDVPSELANLIPLLEPEKRADVLLSLLSYLYPKRKAIEIAHENAVPDEPEPFIVQFISPKHE